MSRVFKLSGRFFERKTVSNEQIAECALCPLYPFDSNSEIIELAFGITIERAPTRFKKSLSRHCIGPDSFWDEDIKVENAWVANLPYLDRAIDLETIEQTKRDAPEMLDNLISARTQKLVFCFITGLRLYKRGLVTPGPVALPTFKGREPIWLTPSWLDIGSEDYLEEEPEMFSLQTADVPAVNNILRDLDSWQVKGHSKNIQVALTRFHSSYRGELEQRMIDQMIAFETLFLGGEQELQYRLALRAACLVGSDAKTKSSIFKNMTDAYKLRSKILHGDAGVDQDALYNILPRTEEYLRTSIRKFLSLLAQGNSLKHVRQKLLDQNILDSEMHL